MTTTATVLSPKPRSAASLLAKEISSFGLVGTVGLAIDLAVFNALFAEGQVVAKTASTALAMVVTYLGNRYFSFKDRAVAQPGRGASIFVGINLLLLAISLAVIALFEYPLHLKHHLLAMNLVNLVTIGFSTAIRFYFYKRFVFVGTPSAVATHRASAPALDIAVAEAS